MGATGHPGNEVHELVGNMIALNAPEKQSWASGQTDQNIARCEHFVEKNATDSNMNPKVLSDRSRLWWL